MQSVRVMDGDPTRRVDRAADGSLVRTIRIKQVDVSPADLNWGEIERGDFELVAGETTSIGAQDLPTERALRLDLLLPAALPGTDAPSARILSLDHGDALELRDVVVTANRNRVRVELEGNWLSPGRYRIEIQATADSQVEPRHFLLEVL